MLLRDLDATVTEESAGTYDISEYAAAFLFDADTEGVSATLSLFRDRFEKHFGDLSDLGHGKWVSGTTVPVGCFVFHKSETDETGTLEDHLAPLVQSAWTNRYTKAQEYIDDNMNTNDKVSNKESERLKAIVTITGQFNNPGDPMSTIIGRNGLPNLKFENSVLSKTLVAFLTKTPWENSK